MTQIHTLKKNGENIYPLTHVKGVVDDNGNTMDVLLAEAEKRALRKLFIAAGAEYNDTDQVIKKTAFWGEEVDHLPHHYYLNGLGDITEEQMVEIYNIKHYAQMIVTNAANCSRMMQGYGTRTIFGVNTDRFLENKTINTGGAPIFNNDKIEVIKWCNKNTTSYYGKYMKIGESIFYGCPSLKVVEICAISNGDCFINCPNLKYIQIHNLATSLRIGKSPLIDKSSIIYTIQNAKPTSAITITLHANAYARLANDVDIVAALEAQPLITLVSA